MVQSLACAEGRGPDLATYEHVVVDECHHVPAVSIERVLADCPARFVTGLTATPYRRDGHQPIIAMQCGPIRHTIAEQRNVTLALRVVRRDTEFDPSTLPPEPSIQEIYCAIASDPRRIDLIVRDIRELLHEGRAPLVLTERREHLDRLEQRLHAWHQP
jgi:superfamily II DNA or RNA helicase